MKKKRVRKKISGKKVIIDYGYDKNIIPSGMLYGKQFNKGTVKIILIIEAVVIGLILLGFIIKNWSWGASVGGFIGINVLLWLHFLKPWWILIREKADYYIQVNYKDIYTKKWVLEHELMHLKICEKCAGRKELMDLFNRQLEEVEYMSMTAPTNQDFNIKKWMPNQIKILGIKINLKKFKRKKNEKTIKRTKN